MEVLTTLATILAWLLIISLIGAAVYAITVVFVLVAGLWVTLARRVRRDR